MRGGLARRFVSVLVAFAIVAGAPGFEAYHACAQTLGRSAAANGGAAPARPSFSAGLPIVSAPIPALSAASFPLSVDVLAAPAGVSELGALSAAASIANVRSAPRAVSASAPRAASKPALTQTAAQPAAASQELSAAATPSAMDLSGGFFDGSRDKAALRAPAVVGQRRGGFARAVAKGLSGLALTVGLLVAQPSARAQTQAPVPAPAIVQTQPTSPAVQAPVPAGEARVALPRPIEASVVVDRQGVTVGERIHLTVTLRNVSDQPVTLQGLRASLQEALPEDLELQGKGAEQPLTLAAGETKTVVYEAIPFGSGILTLDGGIAMVSVGEIAQYPEGIEIVLPKTEIEVKTVLTPDWKEKGFKDFMGVKRAAGANWMWLAAIPLGLLMFVGVYRLVATRRLYPKLDAKRLQLVASTEAELARLKAESPDLDSAVFYARYQDLLTGFMVDFAGLPKASRDARTLARDLKKSPYDAGQAGVAARLSGAAEAARFGGVENDASERMRMIDRFQALVESVARKAGKPDQSVGVGVLGTLALLPGAAGLTFGSPWALLLLIPLAAYALWSWRAHAKGARFAVSSSDQVPARRTLRERLAGLPRVLRMAAVGLIILALAKPMVGTRRTETYIPSTDTVVTIDLSGSMSGAKLEGVRGAVRGYLEEQRRGTENRVGMVTFSDNAYLDVKLTTDYDALIAHLKELETTNSTAIGKAILTSIAHFLELNALELDGKADPRAAEVQRLLKDQGLPAALAYAKAHPDLLKAVLQPERAKIVVVFTDGDSNMGIDPQAAAEIAASLGVKIYGVGIAGAGEYYNEATLRGVTEKTGGKFYRAGDQNAMRDVLLEIARLEKSPVKILSTVSVKDYTSLLAILAFLLIGAEITLANTRLRTLYGLGLVMALNAAPIASIPAERLQPVAAIAQVQAPAPATSEVPAEIIEGNKLYNQGRYADALKKYGEALERHPDVPEIYFNMADAYLRLGENAKAEIAWTKYLALTQDPAKQSHTLFNLGNSALMAGNAEKAVELYKEALRRDSSNQEAKWNLEALKQAQKEQQQQQQQKDSKKGKPGKQKGKPGDGKPGDGKPGDGKPGDGKPGDGKPGDGKPQAKPGDPKEGAEKLEQALGDQQKGEKDAALKGMTRKGTGVWGMAALPLALAGKGVVFSSVLSLWAVGIGLPIAAAFIIWGIKKRLDAAKRLSPGTAPKTFRSWSGARRFLGKSALALAAAGLIGLAGGDPRGGMVVEQVNFGGKDIVVTVDGSYSMIYAEDGRKERTQKELNKFITHLHGADRVGLVVFAGVARTASPISIDYGNFEFKIDRLDVESRGIKEGSDLAAAIKYSVAHFETAKKIGDRQRILIVISDGDVPDAEIAAAIASASEHGVTVYTIGVGDLIGTKIKMPTADGTGTEYLIDSKTGAPAVTKLNEAPLRQLAERTGGAYFRADDKTSIDDILKEVTRREKGGKADEVKSARPLGVYLLWPALLMLFLDMVLPGRSLLKRGEPSAKSKSLKEKKTVSPGAGALLGAALVPLGAWPQILPFAALATIVAGYLAADSWSGGAITRRIRETWQNWRGVIRKGVAQDRRHLYDLREADERNLDAFLVQWRDAKDSARATLIAQAAYDKSLWREKLTAAYLSGASPETLEKIIATLRRSAREHLEPLTPVTDRISARQDQLAWMAHSEAVTRLAALKALAAGMPPLFVETQSRPTSPGLLTRLKRATAVVAFTLMLALTGQSFIGTMGFRAEQRAAVETALRIFYVEDLFVFTDRYIDARIPEVVIPALKRWSESPKTAGADFERAVTILRESPDPKADNILVAMFRHAGVLPLTNNGENILLRALLERESDELWDSMDKLISQSRSDSASAQILVKLVMLGAEVGNDKAVVQLFRALKSPNKQVQQLSASALFARLSSKGGETFFEQLAAAQAKHADDPLLQMWTAKFAFTRLGQPEASDTDYAKARQFFETALANAARLDSIRVLIYKRTPADQEVEAPPSLTAAILGMADRVQGDGGAPAPVAGAVRYLVTKAATNLIQEGEGVIPGLHDRLIKDGVVLPDTPGYGGFFNRGNGAGTVTYNYREVYKLSHLAALEAAIAEMGGPLVADPVKADPAVREFMDRAAAEMKSMRGAAVKCGILAGGSVAEQAAESLLPVLRDGDHVFTGRTFLFALRRAGIAPAVGELSSLLAYPEALDANGLAKLRGFLIGIAVSGKGWDYQGNPRPLTSDERLYLARAVDAVDAAVLKFFPDPSKPVAADPLLDSINRPGDEALVMARLTLAFGAAAKDPALALRIEKLALARLAIAPGEAEQAAGVFARVLPALQGTALEEESYAALTEALRGPAAAQLAPVLRKQADVVALALAAEAEKAFPKLNDALIEAGLRENAYAWRQELKQRHYRNLLAAVEAEAAKANVAGRLTAEQSAVIEKLNGAVPRLIALGDKVGVPTGNDPGDAAAERVNRRLQAAATLFPGQSFRPALAAAGHANSAIGNTGGYLQSYTKAQLEALRDWLKDYLECGTVEEFESAYDDHHGGGELVKRPLNEREKQAVRDVLAAIDKGLEGFTQPSLAGQMRGFAPLALATLPAMAPWLLFAALGLGAAYLVWRLFLNKKTASTVAVGARDSVPGNILARYRRIELTARRMATAVNGGSFRSRFIGAGGTDFAESRPYQNEDRREIDWKTSAKKGETYAKKFELERDMPLMLVVDISRSGRFGTRGSDKRTAIEDAAAVLALAAAHANIRVGLVLVSDRAELVMPARGGSRHAMAIVDAIIKTEPSGSSTDLRPGLDTAGRLFGSRGMIAVLSDFIAPDFKDALGALSSRHDVRAIRVTDPAELAPLPDVGLVPVVDAETGAVRMLDTSSRAGRAEAAAAVSRRESAVERAFDAARVNPILISTEGDPLESLELSFHPKAK